MPFVACLSRATRLTTDRAPVEERLSLKPCVCDPDRLLRGLACSVVGCPGVLVVFTRSFRRFSTFIHLRRKDDSPTPPHAYITLWVRVNTQLGMVISRSLCQSFDLTCPPRCLCVPHDPTPSSFRIHQAKKVAVAGGDASIRIIDIVEERTVDV